MTQHMVLIGTEQVQSAGYRMLEAAERMVNVSSNMQLVFEAHQRFLDDWLQRMELMLDQRRERGL